MIAWLRHHFDSLRRVGNRLGAAPVSSLLNVVVIGVAVALPLLGYLLVRNVETWVPRLQGDPQVTVFLAADASKEDASSIAKSLKGNNAVKSLRFVSRDEALALLKDAVGLGDLISVLRTNPLPDAYILTLQSADTNAGEALVSYAKGLKGVGHAQADFLWSRRLEALLGIVRTALLLLGGALAFALVAVTFNTIRLQILTEQDEIEVARLVGATDAYVRRPFLYWGATVGLAGAVMGLGMAAAGMNWLNGYLTQLGDLYGVSATGRLFTSIEAMAVLALGSLLGWTGGLLSVSAHLLRVD
jgi:cell division transport system permease protein